MPPLSASEVKAFQSPMRPSTYESDGFGRCGHGSAREPTADARPDEAIDPVNSQGKRWDALTDVLRCGIGLGIQVPNSVD
jgi:hypothetical protein